MDDKEKIIAVLIGVIIYLLIQLITPCSACALPQVAPTVLIVNTTNLPHAIIDPAIVFVAQKLPVKIDFLYRRTPKKCKVLGWPKTYSNFACYWRERLKIWDHEGPVIFIANTFSYTGAREAVGGYASVCDLEGVGVLFFGRSKKFEGLLGVLAAHEIGHIFGAEHDPSLPATIMHPAALAFNPSSFSAKSVKEIWQCQK